ncbi:hypothetical protein ABDK00_012000 [Niabella insulamsoli]|uniref:hypothetical protein n=1 Tax=Niabella insulamsoli TaxID=3144874 RepID=UPI0031FC95BF
MKRLALILSVFLVHFVLSCGESGHKQAANEDGFSAIENELKSKFGADAYYTDINVTYNESIGNVVGVTVTKDPASLKMGQWNQTQGNWTQNQDISIEIPQGSQATDFMFQLGQTVSLAKLGELIETSKAQLTKEKQLQNPRLHMASVQYPDNGDVSKAEYLVMLQPETGGTTFSFQYKLNGDFIKMDY